MSKSTKVSDKNNSELVDFDVIRENWHAYELEDNSIVRIKNVLMSITDEGPANEKEAGEYGLRKYGFGINLLSTIHSPKHLRSPIGKVWSVSELEGFIIERNLKFKQTKDGGDAEYETKKSKIIITTHVSQVDKTSKFDKNGMPAYIIRAESLVIVAEKTEKNLEESKT